MWPSEQSVEYVDLYQSTFLLCLYSGGLNCDEFQGSHFGGERKKERSSKLEIDCQTSFSQHFVSIPFVTHSNVHVCVFKIKLLLLFRSTISILIILGSSAYAVVLVVERSQTIPQDNWISRNEVNFVFAGLQFICPIMFNFISCLEENHPRIALRWQLARILVLNILNFVCLLLSTFQKVESQVRR